MKVLFVINNLYTSGNGLSGSVRRTIAALKEKDLEVRVLAAGQSDEGEVPEYKLLDGRIPVFAPLIEKQGYKFAKIDKSVIEEAVQWADIIHLEEPFALEIAVCKIAKKYAKPCAATYHLHPENLFASVGLEKSLWFNNMTMLVWRNTVFNHCSIIQCPTEQVKKRLEAWNFKPELRVISNGITAESCQPMIHKQDNTGKTHIISVGRFSKEKDQDTLLEAMKYTTHADMIHLHFAGKGPTEKHLKRKAAALCQSGYIKNMPTFGFYNQEKLRKLFSIADLYVHSATVEVEGMSCMEAICTGIVPIIAEGNLTATSQFALSENSKYPIKNAKVLAEKIDYWLDHPGDRMLEAQKYIGIEKAYLFEKTIDETILMYQKSIEGNFK